MCYLCVKLIISFVTNLLIVNSWLKCITSESDFDLFFLWNRENTYVYVANYNLYDCHLSKLNLRWQHAIDWNMSLFRNRKFEITENIKLHWIELWGIQTNLLVILYLLKSAFRSYRHDCVFGMIRLYFLCDGICVETVTQGSTIVAITW